VRVLLASLLPDIPAPQDFGPPPWIPERDGLLRVPLWADELVTRAAANILDFARTWLPDVILRETNEYGGQIAAEVLGREALTAAVPMVAVPLFADQPRNAARIEDLKAGVSVGVNGLTAGALAEKIIHVLAAKAYHDAAETLAEEMMELPVCTDLPDHLVSAV
jgi:hypothetical protein